MNQEIKDKLIEAGREDLIDTHYIIRSGFAGINKLGNIVDRRKDVTAFPIPGNKKFVTAEPKIMRIAFVGDMSDYKKLRNNLSKKYNSMVHVTSASDLIAMSFHAVVYGENASSLLPVELISKLNSIILPIKYE